MADITLGDLITLIFDAVAESVHQTTEQAAIARLQVSDVDLDIPAHLRLPVGAPSAEVPARLMVSLPSTRETPAPGRLGRVRVTLARTEPLATEEAP